jgi:hypothetical protein
VASATILIFTFGSAGPAADEHEQGSSPPQRTALGPLSLACRESALFPTTARRLTFDMSGGQPLDVRSMEWLGCSLIVALFADRMEINLHGGFEAGAWGWRGMQDDEMQPTQIAAETLRGNAAPAAEKVLQLGVAAVDGLDVQFAAHPLAGRLVEHLVGNLERGCAGRIPSAAVGGQQGILSSTGIKAACR